MKGWCSVGVQEVVQRVRQQGDAHRKTVQNSVWLPDGSSPLWDIYWRYCQETGRMVGDKVGRCHFWHIVLLIAPLRQLGKQLSRSVGTSFLMALCALAVLGGIEWLLASKSGSWLMPIVLVGAGMNIAGIVFGVGTYWGGFVKGDMSLMGIVRKILNDTDKMSWGTAFALVAGPGILLGMIVMYFVHNVCRLLMKLSPVRFLVKNVSTILFSLVCAVVVVSVGCAAYLKVIRPYGWLQLLIWAAEGLGIVIAAAAVFLILGFAGINTRQHFKEKQEDRTRILIAAGMPLPEPRDNIVKRFFAKVMTALRFVRDIVRLAFEAGRYSYKQVCHLSPVPDRIIAAEREEAEKTKETESA